MEMSQAHKSPLQNHLSNNTHRGKDVVGLRCWTVFFTHHSNLKSSCFSDLEQDENEPLPPVPHTKHAINRGDFSGKDVDVEEAWGKGNNRL